MLLGYGFPREDAATGGPRGAAEAGARATERFETLTLVLGYCGLRFGEAVALRGRHVGERELTIVGSATAIEEYRRAFDKACTQVGIEGLTPHGLRHTTASLAISAGANVKVVQRMLGHATAAMTLDLYGHLLDDDLNGVADALGKAIENTAVSLRYDEQEAIKDELPEKAN